MATVHIFVSYSHENDRWIHEGDHKLIPWLNLSLKRQDVQFWYDHELRKLPGEAYRDFGVSSSYLSIPAGEARGWFPYSAPD